MPLFFVISGSLYKQNGIKSLRKIFWALVIPYIFFQLLYIPIQGFCIWRQQETDEAILGIIFKLICGILLGDGYDTPVSFYVCLPCWFIVSIIQLRLLFSYVKINKVSSSILTFAAISFLYIRKGCDFDLYACIDSTLMAIPYFLLGYWL